MLEPIVECVPNISEGRDTEKVARIVEAVSQLEGAYLLDVDSGVDVNRSVITIVGAASKVYQACYRLIERALLEIDMRQYTGIHPNLGAVDVCPFVPLQNVTLDQCSQLAEDLAEEISRDFKVPIYLYGAAAKTELHQSLSSIRSGGYVGLSEKLRQAEWQADFGAKHCFRRSGVLSIGARRILLAYNVNLKTEELDTAKRIASRIRDKSKSSSSRLPACKAIAWHTPVFECAQISMNLTNYKLTGLFEAFEACKREAAVEGLEIEGSELVGMLPLEALTDVGMKLVTRLGGQNNSPVSELVDTAADYLGLNSCKPFIPSKQILEFRAAELGLALNSITI